MIWPGRTLAKDLLQEYLRIPAPASNQSLDYQTGKVVLISSKVHKGSHPMELLALRTQIQIQVSIFLRIIKEAAQMPSTITHPTPRHQAMSLRTMAPNILIPNLHQSQQTFS